MSNKSSTNHPCAAICLALLAIIWMSPSAAGATPVVATLAASPVPSGQQTADQAPAVAPLETVDQYARRLLEERLAEPEKAEEPTRPVNAGEMGPAQFELIYITGMGKQARALIRLNKQYAKLAGSGEALAGWILADIGPDYVDIYKDEDQARIYLFSSPQAGLRK